MHLFAETKIHGSYRNINFGTAISSLMKLVVKKKGKQISKVSMFRTYNYPTLIVLLNKTKLSYYNVTTRLVDLVGFCWLKQNLVDKYVRFN